jgi:pyruvate formate lyase activating enzyme
MIKGAPSPREAAFYETLPDGRAHCTLCPHSCRITDGYRGACGVRINHRGKLFTLVYNRVACRQVDPIEKKPLFHFLPGTSAFSIATVGCCLQCPFCQNWELSQWPRERVERRVEWTCAREPASVCAALAALEDQVPGDVATPAEIVAAAKLWGAGSIAYTFSEPTVFFELAYDTAALARAQGLKNVFVTSGFIEEGPLRRIAPLLDAANVDLKFFRPESYARLSKARLEPVLDAIRLYHALGVWIEVTTLLVPGLNDSDDEIAHIAAFVRSVSPDVPWHVSRFHSAYRMTNTVPTPVATVRRARQIGLDAGLRYVYMGNMPGDEGGDTCCPGCGSRLIVRSGMHVRWNRVHQGACPRCGTAIAGVRMDGGHEARLGSGAPPLER